MCHIGTPGHCCSVLLLRRNTLFILADDIGMPLLLAGSMSPASSSGQQEGLAAWATAAIPTHRTKIQVHDIVLVCSCSMPHGHSHMRPICQLTIKWKYPYQEHQPPVVRSGPCAQRAVSDNVSAFPRASKKRPLLYEAPWRLRLAGERLIR
jgi:hypothetical protein